METSDLFTKKRQSDETAYNTLETVTESDLIKIRKGFEVLYYVA